LTATKNGHARTVSLSADALKILKTQPAYVGSPLIFPARDRSTGELRPYKQASTNWGECQRQCVRLAKEQGWRFDRFRLHDLRHIYAIDYLAHGGNIYLLQQQLGHGSIRQTEEYLQYLSPEEQVAAKIATAQKSSQPRRFSVAEDAENG
jgi:integrase/recombinase XerD